MLPVFLFSLTMARSFSRQFYNTKAWQKTREAYAKSVGYLCEDCKANGIIKPGEEVHHVIPLSPKNIDNPEITLSWDNLRLLCWDCHKARHEHERVASLKKHKVKRYTVDSHTGAVAPLIEG